MLEKDKKKDSEIGNEEEENQKNQEKLAFIASNSSPGKVFIDKSGKNSPVYIPNPHKSLEKSEELSSEHEKFEEINQDSLIESDSPLVSRKIERTELFSGTLKSISQGDCGKTAGELNATPFFKAKFEKEKMFLLRNSGFY